MTRTEDAFWRSVVCFLVGCFVATVLQEKSPMALALGMAVGTFVYWRFIRR